MKTYYVAGIPYSDELFHYGIKGQKWGIRRFQNEDGTLTPAGKSRYGNDVKDTIENFRTGKNKVQRKVDELKNGKTKAQETKEMVNKMKAEKSSKEKRLLGAMIAADTIGIIGGLTSAVLSYKYGSDKSDYILAGASAVMALNLTGELIKDSIKYKRTK